MSTALHLSAYTPSNMSPETLEAMFVQREKLLSQAVMWCEESITTDKKNHLVFIGPRGSGKTHLITMIINRLQAKSELANKYILVWLGEDDVVTSLTDLALLMLNQLLADYPGKFNDDCLAEARGKPSNDVADIILNSIKVQTGKQNLLVVKENINDVFSGLKDDGQKRLRAHLQENNHITLLTTSQQIFSAISSRDAAFFGFFDDYYLKVLDIKDATQLISNIARLNGNQDLVDFLQTPQGSFRIRALHYLAGGNHRLYVELSSFLTMASLDDFVTAISQLADHLTPYFQEKIRSLPPQQAKIVQKLCELSGAIPVKFIAESLFIGERSVAKQLGDLKDKGYVIAHKRGRESYYEIAEPLLRLSLEVKNNHGKPLKIIAGLFRAWFSDDELRNHEIKGQLIQGYCEAALANKEILGDLKESIINDVMASLKHGDLNSQVTLGNELLSTPKITFEEKIAALTTRACGYVGLKKYAKALEDISEILKFRDEIDEVSLANMLLLNSMVCFEKNMLDEAIYLLEEILNLNGLPDKITNRALLKAADIYSKLGALDKELNCINTILSIKNLETIQRVQHLLRRGFIYLSKNENEKYLKDLNKVLSLKDVHVTYKATALIMKAGFYSASQEYDFVIDCLQQVINMKEVFYVLKSQALFYLSSAYYFTAQIKKSNESLLGAFDLNNHGEAQIDFNSRDILRSICILGVTFWQTEIQLVTKLFYENKVISELQTGLIQSIYSFLDDETIQSSFAKWAELWQLEADKYPDLQVAVDAVNASVLALKERNDKPLLALPQEIRNLVLPMFEGVFEK